MAYSGNVASRGTIPDVLKPVLDKQARDIMPNEYNFWPYVKEADGEKIKLDGEKFEFEVQVARNARSENFSELGDLPVSGVPVWKKGSMQPIRIAQPLQIGHEMAMLADRDVATYTTRLEALWDDAKTALVANLNRQSIGNGTGIVCTITADDDGGGADGYEFTVDDTTLLEEGALYDVFAAAATTNVTNLVKGTGDAFHLRCTAIGSATTATFIMDNGSGATENRPNLAANNVLIRAGSAYTDTTRKTYEMNGIQSITADADFLGIAKTVRPWNAYRMNAAGASIGPRLLAKAEIGKRRKSAAKGKITTVWMSPEQSLEVVYGPSGSYDNIRFSRDDAAKASVKNQNAPSFNFDGRDIQVKTDLYLPVTKAFLFNDEALLVGQLHDVKFEEFGEGLTQLPVFNPTSGRYVAADISWLAWRGNLGCVARNEFVEVYGLPTPA